MNAAPARNLPGDARRSLFVYNLFFPLVLLALIPSIGKRMLKRGGFRENFGQRFGRYSGDERRRFAEGRWLWIHSISVGETLLALKLANELRKLDPAAHCVITVTTSTGFALAQKAASEWLAVLYNPLDAASIVSATLDLIRPAMLVLIEGEAWPNLLAECRRRSIPVALANARLSPRSAGRYSRVRYWVAPIFRLIDLICVPEQGEIARWRGLGLPAEKLRVTGSIKFDAPAPEASRTAEFHSLLRSLGVKPGAPILLAGSTWAPEEEMLTQVFQKLRHEFPDLFLILVPRHVERTPEILRDLAAFDLRTARRSVLASAFTSAAPADILLVDTTGELRDWYGVATVVFVGKSLPGIRDIGGQNPAEPAGLEKPVLFGPHMENFSAIAQLLCRAGNATQIHTPDELLPAISELLRDPERRQRRGQAAREVLAEHRGATARTAALLLPLAQPQP